MLRIGPQNQRHFYEFLCAGALLLSFLQGTNAFAGPGLKALAEANNKLYRDLRDLGPNATTGQKMQMQQQDLGPAYQQLENDHREDYKQWKNAIKRMARATKEQIAALLGHDPVTGKDLDGGPGGTATAKSAPVVPTPPRGRDGAQVGTGDQGGADGAKDAKFGGKRPETNTPKTNADGIIVE